MAAEEVWIIDAVRSPRARGKTTGALHVMHPQQVLAQVLNALVDRTRIDPTDVDDVVMGCGAGTGDHAGDIARSALLDAGWPVTVPGVTLNRYCGSGQQAVTFAAMGIASGQQDLVVAGGVESMSRPASHHVDGFAANNLHLYDQYPMVNQGVAADAIASVDGASREDCDRWAVKSQRRAAVALEESRFERSVVPIVDLDGNLLIAMDELPRPGTTLEDLGRLRPSFEAMGAEVQISGRTADENVLERYPQLQQVSHVHHAGNSSGVADGASAVLLASPPYAERHGLRPRGQITMTSVSGGDPILMLTAPGPATMRCLERAGMTPSDIDLYEVNEAFASVVLRFLHDISIPDERVNVNGGAIALGHPIGATGGMLIGTALDELERRDLGTALITMCTGGGMATATIIERI